MLVKCTFIWGLSYRGISHGYELCRHAVAMYDELPPHELDLREFLVNQSLSFEGNIESNGASVDQMISPTWTAPLRLIARLKIPQA